MWCLRAGGQTCELVVVITLLRSRPGATLAMICSLSSCTSNSCGIRAPTKHNFRDVAKCKSARPDQAGEKSG